MLTILFVLMCDILFLYKDLALKERMLLCMKNYVIYITDETDYGSRFVLSSANPLTKEDVRLAMKQAVKDFCGTKKGMLYLTKEYMHGSNYMSFGDVFYHLKSLPLEKYGLTVNKDICRYFDDTFEFQSEEPIITLDELGLKPLNVTVEYIASSQSVALVPKDIPLEQSIEYAEQNMDMIPRRMADVSYSTGEINPELCGFEEKEENSEDRER